MAKIYNHILNIISLIFFFSLIIYIIYHKIYKTTQMGEITLQNITAYKLFFQTLLFFSVLLSLGYFFILFVKIKSDSSGFLIDKLYIFFAAISKYNPFYKGYSIIFNSLSPTYTIYLVRFTKRLLEFSTKKNRIIMFSAVSLPRCVILFVLLFDIYIMKQLHYYFFALILLIVPLIFRFIIFIFTDLSVKLLPEFSKYVNLGNPENFQNNLVLHGKNLETFSIRLKPEYIDMDLDHVLYNFYYPMLFLGGHMDVNILPEYRKISYYTLLIYYLINSCCWLYILLLLL